jgi:sec1 family domain-containing protein 1
MATIQAAQSASLLSLLQLSDSSTSGAVRSPVWKILVLDETSKDVLATVLRVQDLRDAGVTLHVSVPPRVLLELLGLLYDIVNCSPYVHLSLMCRRSISSPQQFLMFGELQTYGGASFIYGIISHLVEQDLSLSLYESYHLNFTSPLPRAVLEELATLVAKDGTGDLIANVRVMMCICSHSQIGFAQVLDQYLEFLAPSPSLFSLVPREFSHPLHPAGQPMNSENQVSYRLLNSPKSSEQEIEMEVERIAAGLFSVVVTQGLVALIIQLEGLAQIVEPT